MSDIKIPLIVLFLLCSGNLWAQDKILVMGDSLSAAYGITPSRGWVNLLQRQLNQKNFSYRVINASISGETSHGGKRRLPPLIEKYRPKIVLIELGANDGLRGLSLRSLQQNLDSMIQGAKSAGAKVLLIGIDLPPNYGPKYLSAFNKVYANLRDKHKIPLLPSLIKGLEDKSNMLPDGLHPKESVQDKIMLLVWRVLEPLL